MELMKRVKGTAKSAASVHKKAEYGTDSAEIREAIKKPHANRIPLVILFPLMVLLFTLVFSVNLITNNFKKYSNVSQGYYILTSKTCTEADKINIGDFSAHDEYTKAVSEARVKCANVENLTNEIKETIKDYNAEVVGGIYSYQRGDGQTFDVIESDVIDDYVTEQTTDKIAYVVSKDKADTEAENTKVVGLLPDAKAFGNLMKNKSSENLLSIYLKLLSSNGSKTVNNVVYDNGSAIFKKFTKNSTVIDYQPIVKFNKEEDVLFYCTKYNCLKNDQTIQVNNLFAPNIGMVVIDSVMSVAIIIIAAIISAIWLVYSILQALVDRYSLPYNAVMILITAAFGYGLMYLVTPQNQLSEFLKNYFVKDLGLTQNIVAFNLIVVIAILIAPSILVDFITLLVRLKKKNQ